MTLGIARSTEPLPTRTSEQSLEKRTFEVVVTNELRYASAREMNVITAIPLTSNRAKDVAQVAGAVVAGEFAAARGDHKDAAAKFTDAVRMQDALIYEEPSARCRRNATLCGIARAPWRPRRLALGAQALRESVERARIAGVDSHVFAIDDLGLMHAPHRRQLRAERFAHREIPDRRLTKSLNQLKIPPTVQAILAARMDRLPPDQKDLLQTLAVIGREFSFGLLRNVVAKSDDELNRMLTDLQFGEFIYERPATDDIEFIFKHALTQDVAAKSMLIEKRKALHERTAQAIEALYANASMMCLAIRVRAEARERAGPGAAAHKRVQCA
jgi:hypothetical protein